MPARPPEPGKRKQHKQFCHRSSRAAMPSSMVVSRLPVKSARHTTERNGFLSFTCAVGARARDPRPRPPSAPRSPAQVRAHTSLTSLAITSCSRRHFLSWTALMRIASSITEAGSQKRVWICMDLYGSVRMSMDLQNLGPSKKYKMLISSCVCRNYDSASC